MKTSCKLVFIAVLPILFGACATVGFQTGMGAAYLPSVHSTTPGVSATAPSQTAFDWQLCQLNIGPIGFEMFDIPVTPQVLKYPGISTTIAEQGAVAQGLKYYMPWHPACMQWYPEFGVYDTWLVTQDPYTPAFSSTNPYVEATPFIGIGGELCLLHSKNYSCVLSLAINAKYFYQGQEPAAWKDGPLLATANDGSKFSVVQSGEANVLLSLSFGDRSRWVRKPR